MISNCVSHKTGGPRIPTHSARSRSGRSVAASSLSKPTWSEVDDCIKRNPDSRDPIPVRGAHADVARVSDVQAFKPDPQSHQQIFRRACDEMQQMHTEHGPNDRCIGVIVPAELQSTEFEKAERNSAESKHHHGGHSDSHRPPIHSQTGTIDNEHRHTAGDEYQQVDSGETEVRVG